MPTPLLLTAVFAFGSVWPARANLNSGQIQWTYLRDLGYPEPNWALIKYGDPTENAIVVNAATQIWGDVVPFDTSGSPLCRWEAGPDNSGHGSCKTDISWLHSAVGISKGFFSNKLVNYIIRFHLFAACFRSTLVCFTFGNVYETGSPSDLYQHASPFCFCAC
jgi:hypothetical protein